MASSFDVLCILLEWDFQFEDNAVDDLILIQSVSHS